MRRRRRAVSRYRLTRPHEVGLVESRWPPQHAGVGQRTPSPRRPTAHKPHRPTAPPPQPAARITLSLPVLNAAQNVAFISGGAGKAPVLAEALGVADGLVTPQPASGYPCAMVSPR